MTTAHDIDWPQMLADRLTSTSPDVLRELLMVFLHTLMGAEADALCGASYGERSAERTNQRNGYRRRQFDTRTGTLDLARLRWPFQGVPARESRGPVPCGIELAVGLVSLGRRITRCQKGRKLVR